LNILLVVHPIVHVNATLNATATVLLLMGLWLIRRNRVAAHGQTMLLAFVVSIAFLACYAWYHYQVGSVKFTHPGGIRYVYYVILASHVLLAATVPFLAIRQIYLGLRAVGWWPSPGMEGGQSIAAACRVKHRLLARWTYPIWLVVSATGVIVYVMLYHLWPPVE
jgi:uncharacterized membrane protein YozB (DUF420 family)